MKIADAVKRACAGAAIQEARLFFDARKDQVFFYSDLPDRYKTNANKIVGYTMKLSARSRVYCCPAALQLFTRAIAKRGLVPPQHSP